MSLSYDMCISRGCNICLFFENNQDTNAGTTKKKLRKCSGCLLIYYCSPQHQRLDWPLHRDFCRAAKELMDDHEVVHPFFLNGEVKDAHELGMAIFLVKHKIRLLLERPMEFHEEQLTSFPAYCEVCYKFERLYSCPHCLGVSYCSTEHNLQDRAKHQKQCDQLKLYNCPYKVREQVSPDKIVKVLHKPVPDLSTMDLMAAFEHVTKLKLPANPTSSMEDYQLFACAGDFNCMGSILYTLRFANTMVECSDGANFVIFIVGAVMEQSLWFRLIHTRWFFLQYPQIKRLELHFIGPEVQKKPRLESKFMHMGAERTVLYATYTMLFENFCQKNNIKPSIIACFNCGFSEFPPETLMTEKQLFQRMVKEGGVKKGRWHGGILKMLQFYDVPILFTSLGEVEAQLDYNALSHIIARHRIPIEIKRLFDAKVNPYRDIRPLRNWHSEHDNIYYRNNYIQAFVSKAKK